MNDGPLGIRLTGVAPAATVLTVALLALGLALVWRRRPRTRAVLASVGVVGLAAGLALVVNTDTDAYPTVGDLVGAQRYPTSITVPTDAPTGNPQPNPEPKGEVVSIAVPDTASHFGEFDAQVWLPPEYFSQPTVRFPVVILTHGNPGQSTNWLDDGRAAQTGLAVAAGGHPVILVMPTVLRGPTGDSLCVDTALEGNAETYVVTDVVTAVDSRLRTLPDARHRAIGGFSMGGFCALNLGLKHPDVFSVVLAFSAQTVCVPDAIDGGNEELFGGDDWQAKVAANSPAEYYPSLNPTKGPALWIDVGDEETDLVHQDQALASELSGKGFVVEFRERRGGHDFATWTAALQESLPWAAARLAS